MEVLNKFEKLRSSLSSSVSSTVFSTISTVKDVLPGNPVTRDFEVGEHVASGGPGLLWKIYSGSKKSTKQAAAVFVLEKRLLDAHFPEKLEREALLDQFRKAIAQLTRLRHPQILTVQHPLEESRDSLAFATEPVYASLANVLGRHDNLPAPVPAHLRDYKLFEVEIKYGLLQLCEGLAFLHDSVKMLHRNIAPESIILNQQGAWKIFGFDFCLPNKAVSGAPPVWDFPMGDAMSSDALRPDLDFMAPEYGLDGGDAGVRLGGTADMFSLGMVAFSLHNTKPLFTNEGSWSAFKRNAGGSEFKSLRESNLQLIPPELRSSLKLMLNFSPDIRPTAEQMTKIPYFEDVGVKTLNNLDTQFQWDNLQKSQFYKGLPQVLPRLPHRVSLHRVVPCLAKEFVNPHMVPFVLPSVLYIAEQASKTDYVNHILPELKPVMKITDPIQVLLIFMQRMEMLLSKTPPPDVKSDVLPMIYRALEADTAQIQELCLSIIPGFAGLLEFQATKTALLPRIKKLCITTGLLSVRVNCLVCIGKLLQHLDKWLVLDDVLPMLQQIPSREPAVVMAIVGIYKLTLSDSKLGMTKEIIASNVLPFLFPLSIENGLSVSQYTAVMNLIRELIAKVEEEHRAKLEQLNSIQAETKSALQVSMSDSLAKPDQLVAAPAAGSGKQSEMDDMFSGLGLASYVGKHNTAGSLATSLMDNKEKSRLSPMTSMTSSNSASASAKTTGTGLSLEQKQRILQNSETQKRISSQSPLAPASNINQSKAISSPSGNKSGTKDLTASLINSNLSQIKTSQTFNNGTTASLGQQQQWQSTAAQGGGWGVSGQASLPGMNAPSWGAGGSPMMQQGAAAAAANTKPDLSAFDNLLPMKAKQPLAMNSMRPQQPAGAGPMGGSFMPQQQSANRMQPMALSQSGGQQQNKPPVKSLTANDITDLLG